jgi:hypothetical protein
MTSSEFSQMDLDLQPATSALQQEVDLWLLRYARTIHSWEGEISDEHGLDRWLPGYNHGVYIVGEYVRACFECDGCDSTPVGFRTCRPRVKIGIASDMYMRFANLKCGSSRELEIMALMPFPQDEMREVERELHEMFAPTRVATGRKTEWFWNSAELESLVCEVVSFGAEYAGKQ